MIRVVCDNPGCRRGWIGGPNGYEPCPYCVRGFVYIDEKEFRFPWARLVAAMILFTVLGAVLAWIAR